ncbi:MAG: tetratricopeptide repeat protein [Xenococcaceae cyanobacterium]
MKIFNINIYAARIFNESNNIKAMTLTYLRLTHILLGNFDRSEQTLQNSLSLDSECSTTFYYLSLLAECKGNRSQAKSFLEKSIKLSSELPKIGNKNKDNFDESLNDLIDWSVLILSRIDRRRNARDI